MTQRFKSEEGSILIMTMVAMLAVIGFSAMAFDMGVLFVGRGGAQNLADAGALAGATAWAYDEPDVASTDLQPGGATIRSILLHSDEQPLLGEQTHTVEYDFACPAQPIAPAGASCVRVDVYRDGGQLRAGGNNASATLPTFFAHAFGIGSQTTRATATAMHAIANGSMCLKPWLIPDKFNDVNGDGKFDSDDGDTYIQPGWTLDDVGTVLTLTPGHPNQAISASDFFEIEEATSYEEAIYGCEITKQIGDIVNTLPGHRVGPTGQGVTQLLANNNNEPVVVAIGMFSPVEFEQEAVPHGNFDLEIVNILGFRIDPVYNSNGPQTIRGTIVSMPGDLFPGATPAPGAAFLKVIRLIQ